MLDAFGLWLKDTQLSSWVTGNRFVWPASETLHFIGLAMLIGCVGALDLRMLGVAKGLPVKSLHRFIPFGIAGFVINLVTGTLFFVGEPSQYIHNISFQLKMLLIVIAGLNVLIFYGTVFRDADSLSAGEDAPFKAKIVATVSITAWLGVMYFGRMLPFIGEAF
jgi:hypothetical protein